MPAFLVPFLVKTVLPWIIQELVKAGIIPSSVGAAIVDFEDFKAALQNIKTYSTPEDFPVQKDKFTPVN